MDATAGDHSAPGEESTAGSEPDEASAESVYTPQPTALRRQQFVIAVVGAVLGGGALAVSLSQRYPDYRSLWILAGGAVAIVLFRLVSGSIFPGTDSSDPDADSDGEGDSSETDDESPEDETTD